MTLWHQDKNHTSCEPENDTEPGTITITPSNDLRDERVPITPTSPRKKIILWLPNAILLAIVLTYLLFWTYSNMVHNNDPISFLKVDASGGRDDNGTTEAGNERLFQSIGLGALQLKHRVVMCPLTRCRADEAGVHSDLAVEYYKQRASAGGLLVTEGTIISAEAGGQSNVPGVYSPVQIDAWKRVTSAVHNKGGFIFCQLWALGRVADSAVVPNGKVYAPSDVTFEKNANNGPGCTNLSVMSEGDIDRFVGSYVGAAKGAVEAGFDGVELHAANGYLLDQFLQTNTNTRTDAYGGSPANRVRLILRILESISSIIPPSKIGIRISPLSTYQGMRMSPLDLKATYTYLLEDITSKWDLAYVHIIRGEEESSDEDRQGLEILRKTVRDSGRTTKIIIAGNFDPAQARDQVSENEDELVAFGRYFIANPDLPYRIKNHLPLSTWDDAMFYTHSAKGYIE
ncbi:hypothetical protein IAT40_002566 [Kwoniella sp. CBS 6097]